MPPLFCPLLLVLSSLAASGPDWAAVRHALDQGRIDTAETLLAPFAADSPGPPAQAYEWARLHLSRGETAAALAAMRLAYQADPGNARYLAGMGTVTAARIPSANLLHKAVLARQVQSYYRRAIDADPAWPEPWFGLIEYALLAPGLLGGGASRAENLAAQLFALDPYYGWLARARLALHRQDLPASLQALEQALALRSDDRWAHLSRTIVGNNLSAWDSVQPSLDFLLNADPRDLTALYQAGKFSALSGQNLDRGESALRTYLERVSPQANPSPAHAWHRLGQILRHRGDLTSAHAAWRQALHLDPDLQAAREELDRYPLPPASPAP